MATDLFDGTRPSGLQRLPARRVHHKDLHQFTALVLQAKGMRAEDAATVADTLVWADLRGIDSHGVGWLPKYVQFCDTHVIDAAARPSLELESSSRFVLDGNRCAGAVAMMQAMAMATARAVETGSCIGGVRNTTHTGAIGRYAVWAAERGCAAIVFVAGPPFMMYHGARVPSVSTTPIAIAVPTADRPPIVLDMATSVIAFSKLRQARAQGESLPPGTALADDGSPTRDPARAVTPAPIGGPKGSGLALMIELVASVLLGSPILADHLAPSGRRRHQQNALMIVPKTDAFGAGDSFTTNAASLTTLLRQLPRAAGTDEIRLPGQRSAGTALERTRTGIPITLELWQELNNLATSVRVDMPSLWTET
jgi:ureidoglycolate dehydrogenase (NAD+)